MKKTAAAEHPIHEVIAERWSARAYDPVRPVGLADVETILEAARWAASAMNAQPWAFVYALRGEEGFSAIFDALVPGNHPWNEKAAGFIVGVAQVKNAEGQPYIYGPYDLGQAMAQASLQASILGLAWHQMAGFDGAKLSASLGIPDGYQPYVVASFGWPGAADDLPEPYKSRETAPRTRKPFPEIARHGKW